ncbi:MAG: hypothetical protein H6Q90_2478 [Deltaproteobacteria bacterium]|nr:hypothetical protein [Deltaproteobacteria bacterium]
MFRPMSPEILQVLLVAFTVWGGLVAYKAVGALRRREPYTFSMWDGGMLRAGKHLNRTGTIVKVVTAGLVVAWCALALAGVYMHGTTYYVFVGLIIASVISDMINSDG